MNQSDMTVSNGVSSSYDPSISNRLRPLFLLDPDLAFLNHGSFGATPRPVFEEYQEWQRRFEWSPVEYHARKFNDLMREARRDLGRFINAAEDEVVFCTNATVGVNIVGRSIGLREGDEVLTTDHEYGACDRLWDFLQTKEKFTVRRVPIPAPVTSPQEVIDRMKEGMNDRTKLLFISHITSPTAVTFPVKEICAHARERGILTLIDGAHAIGQIDLDMEEIGADFYTSNLHKWLCAPKGSAFLYAPHDRQKLLDPLVVSWGYNPVKEFDTEFIAHHEYRGTQEVAAPLSTGRAIRFQDDENWSEVREHSHQMVRSAYDVMTERFGFAPLTVDSPDLFRQMSSFILPEQVDAELLKTRLFDEDRVEIPVMKWNDRDVIRISVQGYNSQDDLDRLYNGLDRLLKELL